MPAFGVGIVVETK